MQIDANDFCLCSLAIGQFFHIARRLTCTHAWLMKWVLVCPVRSDVTIIMWVQVPKVLGGCHVWIPGSSLGQLVKALHTLPYANNCDGCCRALHEAVHLWLVLGHSKAAPPPLLCHLLLQWDLLDFFVCFFNSVVVLFIYPNVPIFLHLFPSFSSL